MKKELVRSRQQRSHSRQSISRYLVGIIWLIFYGEIREDKHLTPRSYSMKGCNLHQVSFKNHKRGLICGPLSSFEYCYRPPTSL